MQNNNQAGTAKIYPSLAGPILKVRELSFYYENKAGLSCPSLDVQEGECLAFVGPNGSGKTTLLKLLNGLLGPYSGRIEFMGQPLSTSRLLRRRSVYLHQHPVLFAGSVRDNIAYALRLKHFNKAESEARLTAAASRFSITGLLDREAGRLSGGETQRVAMARAVAAGVDVLLLDEPTSSMDKASELAVRDLLMELKNDGATILFSSHDEALVTRLADRVLRFKQGYASVHNDASSEETSFGTDSLKVTACPRHADTSIFSIAGTSGRGES